MKTCSKCKAIKPLSEFNICNKTKTGLAFHCKECNKKYRQLNKEKLRLNKKEWYLKNKERIAIKNFNRKDERSRVFKVWHNLNKDKRREYKRNRMKNNTSNCKVASRIRSRIYIAFKRGGLRKRGKTLNYLGCSWNQLKEHLESLFEPNMSWSNYGYGVGKWNLEHHYPFAIFDLTNEIDLKIVCNYRNIRPMWQHENFVKGSKVLDNFDKTIIIKEWLI